MAITLSTAAENFKGQLRTAAHQAKEAQILAQGYKGIAGSTEFKWAADIIAEAVVKANQHLDRVTKLYGR